MKFSTLPPKGPLGQGLNEKRPAFEKKFFSTLTNLEKKLNCMVKMSMKPLYQNCEIHGAWIKGLDPRVGPIMAI